MKFLILLSVMAFASCTPVAQEESVFRLFLGNLVNCANGDIGLCLKEQALKTTERLRTVRKIQLYEGITIINDGPKESRSLELSTEPEIRKRQVTEKLWENAADLMKSSELELSYDPISERTEESRAMDVAEGRSKKKKEVKQKLKILLPLLLLAKAKAVAIAIAALVVIAVSLAKLAFLAKIAFIAKVIAALKHKLHKHHEEDHGWVPHEEHHDHGWEGGWSRSRNDANNIAYNAYSAQ